MMATRVERAGSLRLAAWSAMRATLWPSSSAKEHAVELAALLGAEAADLMAFLAVTSDGDAVGFAEAALRRDYVNGCETTPVVFLEGIFVVPEHRRTGVARMLVASVEDWARRMECTEMASDALLENSDSHAFHVAAGFEETERVVFFRKALNRG